MPVGDLDAPDHLQRDLAGELAIGAEEPDRGEPFDGEVDVPAGPKRRQAKEPKRITLDTP